jgi:hypothetical protein
MDFRNGWRSDKPFEGLPATDFHNPLETPRPASPAFAVRELSEERFVSLQGWADHAPARRAARGQLAATPGGEICRRRRLQRIRLEG